MNTLEKMELRASGQIAALGWTTHSRTSHEKRAYIGSDIHPIKTTGFHATWQEVLFEALRIVEGDK